MREPIYLYGFVAKGGVHSIPGSGVERRPVELCQDREIAAVISRMVSEDVDPSRENLLAHQRVSEILLRRTDFLPARFASICATPVELRELMESHGDQIRMTLAQIGGKREWALEAFWDLDATIRRLAGDDGEIQAFLRRRGELASHGYGERIAVGKRVEVLLTDERACLADELLRALRPTWADHRINPPLSDRMAVNIALLVARQREAEFEAQVHQVGDEYEGALDFKYSGPWPPYNFVDQFLD